MNRNEIKEFIAELIDDTLESINFQINMKTGMEFDEIEEIIDEVWSEVRNGR